MVSQVLQKSIKAHEDFMVAHSEEFRLSVPLWRLLAEGRTIMVSQVLQKSIKAHEDFMVAHSEEFRLSLPLWRLLAEGKPVSPGELATASRRSLPELQALVQTSDMRVDQAGNILPYGPSPHPTPHPLHLPHHSPHPL